jgi:aryl-alcohol dehydrogenase-like predicted oxidoreductase
MQTRAFGETGLTVSKLGLGAGQIGDASLDERGVEQLLNTAVDLGITLVDTARGYGLSEERIGRHLGAHRDRVVLSSKGGYGVDGVADWTGEVIRRGIDDALTRLRTDRLDIFHLHSCPREVLELDEVVRALEDVQRAGKVRVAAYSGENDALTWAVDSGRFGSIQCSVNLVEQRVLSGAIATAAARGLGVIGKRPLFNAAWRFRERPIGDYAEPYWERFQSLRERMGDRNWPEVALRFAAFASGVSSVIVGTRNLANLRANAAALERGPLEEDLVGELRRWFRESDRGWAGQI